MTQSGSQPPHWILGLPHPGTKLCADPGEPAGELSKYMYLTGHAYFLCVAHCQL